MSFQDLPEGLPITEEDWKQTPPSVRALVLWQHELIQQLIKRVEELEAKLGQNSQNSNRPPSSDAHPPTKERRENRRERASLEPNPCPMPQESSQYQDGPNMT